MDYLWDVLINAKNNGMNMKDIDFEFASSFSPYMELSNVFLNSRQITRKVDINPFYRFFKIFKFLMEVNYQEEKELREVLFNILIHFIGQLDLKRGINRIEYYKLFIYREIKEGYLGQIVKKNIDNCSIIEKDILLGNILKLYKTGNHIYYFKDTIKKIYKGSIVYINKRDNNEILVYIKQMKTARNYRLMELIKLIFLPINFKVKTYWKFHFGIVGIKETMKINSISIY
ncbi:MAG: iron-dependent peroxidase [bacterium]